MGHAVWVGGCAVPVAALTASPAFVLYFFVPLVLAGLLVGLCGGTLAVMALQLGASRYVIAAGAGGGALLAGTALHFFFPVGWWVVALVAVVEFAALALLAAPVRAVPPGRDW